MSFCPQYQSNLVILARCLAYFSLSCAAAVFTAGATEPGDASWSPESNGLKARLIMRRMSVFNGTARIATYLELKNVSRVGNPLILKRHPLTFTATDSEGHDVPMSGLASYSGPSFDLPPLVLPHDSQLRFRIGPTGYGVRADQAASLDLGIGFYREFPRDGKAYYLQGTLDLRLKRNESDRESSAVVWQGKLVLPRVRIPTEPDPVDPKSIGPRIEELGPKLLNARSDISDAAADELSLIDDPRVIPWYLKAVRSNSYSLRYAALDRLSRMEGDEAFEGLKIGMTTSGADMGNCATEKVAADSAGNIRVSAAYALARSPHPQAKGLLWTLEKDRSKSVRLIVVQTAAGVDTPEGQAIVQRGTQDADELVRGEATRLLIGRKKPN
jgi:HEAT repeat protein